MIATVYQTARGAGKSNLVTPWISKQNYATLMRSDAESRLNVAQVNSCYFAAFLLAGRAFRYMVGVLARVSVSALCSSGHRLNGSVATTVQPPAFAGK